MATGKAIIYKGIPYFSDVKVPTRVSQLANDAGYVTTDEKVKQTPNTTSMDSHPILFSASDSSGEVVGGAYKNSNFYYNPSLNRMIFKNGGGIEVRSGTTNVSILSYIHLSDLTDACSIMNITTEDIELDDVTSQGTTYSNTWDGTHHSLKSSISSLTTGELGQMTKVGTKFNFGSQNVTLRVGREMQCTLVITVTSAINDGETFIKLPKAMRIPCIFLLANDAGTVYKIGNTDSNSDEVKALYGSGLPAGNYRGSFTYLTVI